MTTKHSENKTITNFKNEVGPGVLQSSVQQALLCKNFKQQGHTGNLASLIQFVPLKKFDTVAADMLLNAGLEYSRSYLVFRQSRLRNNFIFGILYSLTFWAFYNSLTSPGFPA